MVKKVLKQAGAVHNINHSTCKSIKFFMFLLCTSFFGMVCKVVRQKFYNIMSYTTPACFSTFFDLLWSVP